MKIPKKWISQYINIEGTFEDFGEIMTSLEFMKDGPIKEIRGDQIIDIEVRQNRPDVLSIIGAAREYAAFTKSNVNLPEIFDYKNAGIEWKKPEKIIRVDDKKNVKRFTSALIFNVKVDKSPDWIIEHLESYGIPSINNIVDITNYVMIEYGIPMHAFDLSKIEKNSNSPYLIIQKAENGEIFSTWQNTKIKLTTKDTVISDYKKTVAIAGVIGGANSDIDFNTVSIILEAACYDQASVRRTSMRHNIRTEASSRHEKFLSPYLVKDAMLRAIYLIQKYANGEINQIEDYFNDIKPNEIEFTLNEIQRLSGVYIESELSIELLKRLGFEIIEHTDAIGIDKEILTIRVPKWRTDINCSADIVEEVLRLWGYKNIPTLPLQTRVPDFGTPHIVLLEDFIKDVLVSLGLYEHVLSPFVKKNNTNTEQIVLENALNSENEALRTSILESLTPVSEYYQKAGKKAFGIYESGKVYYTKKEGEYIEEKRIESLYINKDFATIIKPNLLTIFSKLGLGDSNLSSDFDEEKSRLIYKYKNIKVAILNLCGYELFIEKINELVDVYSLPKLKIKTSLSQIIWEDLTFNVSKNMNLGIISETIVNTSEYIKDAIIKDIFEENASPDHKSITFSILFEDISKKLTRENIESIKSEILDQLKKIKVEIKNSTTKLQS